MKEEKNQSYLKIIDRTKYMINKPEWDPSLERQLYESSAQKALQYGQRALNQREYISAAASFSIARTCAEKCPPDVASGLVERAEAGLKAVARALGREVQRLTEERIPDSRIYILGNPKKDPEFIEKNPREDPEFIEKNPRSDRRIK